YIQGKRPGTTNVSLFDGDARLIGVLDLEVTLDAGNLQEKIRGTSVGTQGIRVNSTQGQVVLSGIASDAVAVDRAMSIAKSLAGDQPVVNAMQVAPSQQVMLEVRFLEVSRDAGRELGVNWQVNANNRQFVQTGLGSAGFGIGAPGGPGHGFPIVGTAGTLVGQSLTGPFGTVLANIFNR